jgi:hypothetical protein
MPDYSKSKIYTIRCRTNESLIYVGSTTEKYLSTRLAKHRGDSKLEKCMNYKLYVEVNNDWSNWYIELHENYPCNSKEELCKREGEIIRQIGTLNSKIAGRDKRQYYFENIDKIKEYQKQYQIENFDKIKEQQKHYQIENSEKIKEYKKEYKIKNAEKIKEQQKQYYKKKKNEISI